MPRNHQRWGHSEYRRYHSKLYFIPHSTAADFFRWKLNLGYNANKLQKHFDHQSKAIWWNRTVVERKFGVLLAVATIGLHNKTEKRTEKYKKLSRLFSAMTFKLMETFIDNLTKFRWYFAIFTRTNLIYIQFYRLFEIFYNVNNIFWPAFVFSRILEHILWRNCTMKTWKFYKDGKLQDLKLRFSKLLFYRWPRYLLVNIPWVLVYRKIVTFQQ